MGYQHYITSRTPADDAWDAYCQTRQPVTMLDWTRRGVGWIRKPD